MTNKYQVPGLAELNQSLAEFQRELDESAERLALRKAARASKPKQPTITDVMAMLERLMAEMVALRSAA